MARAHSVPEARAAQPGQGVTAGGEAVDISITSPSAATDPNTDEVLTASEVTVTCLARAGRPSETIDAGSVKVAVLDEEGEVIAGADDAPLERTAAPTGKRNDEYAAKLQLGAVPSGRASFRCRASTVNASSSGEATLPTLVDHGPAIFEKLPAINSAHSLVGALTVEFSVVPAPLTEDDEEADVASVKLIVAGAEIEDLTEDSESPGTFRATVNFQDPELYDEPPTERTSVRIEATNRRTDTAATAIYDYPFVVDGVPPSISIKKPVQNAAVKGETIVEFTAVDSGAGVDLETVRLSLNSQKPILYSPTDTRWGRTDDTFKFRFDTAAVGGASAQITVDIGAADKAGNRVDGDSRFLWLDDVAPVVDLDPGNWRIHAGNVCSASFDPLADALDDGEQLGGFALIRALVFDQTKNTGQPTDYPALADRGSAKLYAQVAPAQPFLVDTDADGLCDSLAREDFPFKALKPLSIAGAALDSNAEGEAAKAPAIAGQCALRPASPSPPDSLCGDFSDMQVAVQHDVIGFDEPVIYGMGGLTGIECTGTSWDPITIETDVEGWICYAAVASDKLGNSAVSRPLRICYDNPNTSARPACATTSTEPPRCTDGCTARAFPAHLQKRN